MATNPYRGVINRIPPGLLSLLGLKQLGRNPDELGSVVAPTMELAPWYMSSIAEVVTASQAFGGGSANDFQTLPALTVPSSEWWYVWEDRFAASATAPWGPDAVWAGWRYGGATSYVPGLQTVGIVTASASPIYNCAGGAAGQFIPPGSNCAVFFRGGAIPTNPAAAGYLRITRLPI